MTNNEIIALKKYIEGVYPQAKQNNGNDAVWVDMLSTYEYQGMMQSLKTHIRSGNVFPPSIPELISGYDIIISSFDSDIADQMQRDGIFNDDTSKPEVAEWNKLNRITKAKIWMKTNVMPDWFRVIYDTYKSNIEKRYFGTRISQNQIGGN